MSIFISALFPDKCVSCGAYLDETNCTEKKSLICNDCRLRIVKNEPPYCIYCGVGKDSCGCRRHSHAYNSVAAPFYYEGAIKDAIGRMKFSKQEGVCRFLADHLREEICARYFGINFDILTCVPATGNSIAERGFNQSRSIAENLNLPKELFPNILEDYNLLIKHSGGQMQHKLGAESRRKNIEKSYDMGKNRNVVGKNILLIDDILTTGATADACACILKLNGAKSVYVATPAITRIKNQGNITKKTINFSN